MSPWKTPSRCILNHCAQDNLIASISARFEIENCYPRSGNRIEKIGFHSRVPTKCPPPIGSNGRHLDCDRRELASRNETNRSGMATRIRSLLNCWLEQANHPKSGYGILSSNLEREWSPPIRTEESILSMNAGQGSALRKPLDIKTYSDCLLGLASKCSPSAESPHCFEHKRRELKSQLRAYSEHESREQDASLEEAFGGGFVSFEYKPSSQKSRAESITW